MLTINTFHKLSGFLTPCVAFGALISATTTPANASENTCQPEWENEMEALPSLTKSGHKDWQQNYQKHQRRWMQNQQQWQGYSQGVITRSPIYRPFQANWSSNYNYMFKTQSNYSYYLRELERSQQRSRKQYKRIIQEQQRQLRKIWGF